MPNNCTGEFQEDDLNGGGHFGKACHDPSMHRDQTCKAKRNNVAEHVFIH